MCNDVLICWNVCGVCDAGNVGEKVTCFGEKCRASWPVLDTFWDHLCQLMRGVRLGIPGVAIHFWYPWLALAL